MYNTLTIPIIAGLILLLAINHALVLWQMERTWRVFSIFLFYFFLFGLYLVAALSMPTFWRERVRDFLLLAAVFANIFNWSRLINFLKNKDKKHAQLEQEKKAEEAKVEVVKAPESKTLAELANSSEPAAIVAVTPPINGEKL